MTRRFLIGAVVCLGLGVVGAEAPRPLRVALMDPTTDGHDYPLMVAASQFAGLLVPRLVGLPGLEWVERERLRLLEEEQKLGLAARVDPQSAIRQGKWVKADVAVLSQVSDREGGGRELGLQAIDLDHAEALAERTVTIPGDLTNDGFVQQAAEQLRALLAEARTVRDRRSTQHSLVVLFFHNRVAPRVGDDLDVVERSFGPVLDRAAETVGDVHVVRLAHAGKASEEAELVLTGLVETDPAAWENVADLYVWGGLAPDRPDGRAGTPTSAVFTLNLWDGRGPPETERQTVTNLLDTARVTEVLESLARRAVERVRRASASSLGVTDTA